MKKLEIHNPYTLQFSYLPPKLIERNAITSEIVGNFTRQLPTYRGMSSDVFTQYRTRLIDSGAIDGSQYGYLRFRLPRFEEYIRNRRNMY